MKLQGVLLDTVTGRFTALELISETAPEELLITNLVTMFLYGGKTSITTAKNSVTFSLPMSEPEEEQEANHDS